jgi:cobalt-precorrin-7 (C5)-methyltransferase
VAGISAAQILASRCRVCFDETSFITFHRRGNIVPFQEHLVHALQDDRNAIVIPRPWDFMPKAIADFLLARGVAPEHQTEVWERLSQNEASWLGTLGDCRGDFSDMSIMLIRTLRPMESQLEPVATRSHTSGTTENASCGKEEGRATQQNSITSTKTN